MKRLIALIAMAFVATVWADTATVGGYTWTYYIENNKVGIYKVSPEPSGEMVIPSSLGGKPVAYIWGGFRDCKSLTGVTIPDGVEELDLSTFFGCSSLVRITIPDSVSSVYDGYYDGEVLFKDINENLFDTATMQGIKLIDGWAVGYTDKLSGKLNLKGVRGIADWAFEGCEKLTSVTIPKGVKNIGEGAFFGCSSLASVSIADGVSVDGDAFEKCDSSLYDTTTIRGVKLVDGWAVGYTDELPKNLNLTGVRGIASSAFGGCQTLVSVVIPKGVTDVGNYCTFQSCDRLESVIISEGVTSITRSMFSSCRSLKSVTIPNSVTNIGDYAFGWSTGLTSVTIGKGVKNIGEEAFKGCHGLMSISVNEDNPNYKSVNGLLLSKDGKTLVQGVNGKVTMPNSVTRIGAYAFAGRYGLESIKMPDSVKSIGNSAFTECGLKSVTIGNGVTSIERCAFDCCGGLTEATIGNSVTTIGEYAFADCPELKTVNMPAALKGKFTNAFYGSDGVTIKYYSTKKTVEFNANGGTASVTSIKKTQGEKLGTLPTATRKGYVFTGWFTAAKGGTKITESTKAAKDVTYYAQWKAISYTVTFNGNGATSGKTYTISRKFNDKQKLENKFKRTNYHLKGWATKKGGSIVYAAADTKNLTSKNGAKITLYAVWEQDSYTVIFNANGGKGEMKNQKLLVGGKKVALSGNTFKRTGYTFAGWNTKADGKGTKYTDKQQVQNLSKKNGAKVTLYAQWKANKYKIAFNANGGTGTAPKTITATYGKNVTLPKNTFKRSNYTFAGWGVDKKTVKYAANKAYKNLKSSGTITLYAVWTRNTYTVKFDLNGGKGTAATKKLNTATAYQIDKLVTAPTKSGFVFKGWKGSNGKTYAANAKIKDLAKSGKTITLTAIWELPDLLVGPYEGMVGYFEGPVEDDEFNALGVLSLSIASSGKVSATVAMLGEKYTFSASGFKSCSKGVYTYTLKEPNSNNTLTFVADTTVSGFDRTFFTIESDFGLRLQDYGNLYAVAWKDQHVKNGAISKDSFASKYIAEIKAIKTVYLKAAKTSGDYTSFKKGSAGNKDLTLTINANGTVAAKGRVLGVNVNATSALKIDCDDYYTIFDYVIDAGDGTAIYIPCAFSLGDGDFSLTSSIDLGIEAVRTEP